MMSLWDALRMNMMISYQELVRTFLSKGMGPGCLAGNFQSHTDFIFSTGNTLNISLSLRAGAKFPGHATEVLRTISIFKRGAIKINIFTG